MEAEVLLHRSESILRPRAYHSTGRRRDEAGRREYSPDDYLEAKLWAPRRQLGACSNDRRSGPAKNERVVEERISDFRSPYTVAPRRQPSDSDCRARPSLSPTIVVCEGTGLKISGGAVEDRRPSCTTPCLFIRRYRLGPLTRGCNIVRFRCLASTSTQSLPHVRQYASAWAPTPPRGPGPQSLNVIPNMASETFWLLIRGSASARKANAFRERQFD
jgi:hypothetical protein